MHCLNADCIACAQYGAHIVRIINLFNDQFQMLPALSLNEIYPFFPVFGHWINALLVIV
jgi:hypothetical protein